MSKPARWMVLLVFVATVVLEVVAYLMYRNAIDGVFVNMAVAVYGLLAGIAIWAIDRIVRRFRHSARRLV